jgi:hypothetical protein
MSATVIKFPCPMGEAKKAALRARAEVIAAEYAAPLPEGDAGLIEAERRHVEVNDRKGALYDEFDIDFIVEEDVLNPIVDAPWARLCDFIEETAPRGVAGVAAKLRYLQLCYPLVDDEPWGRMIAQMVALLEEAEAQHPR